MGGRGLRRGSARRARGGAVALGARAEGPGRGARSGGRRGASPWAAAGSPPGAGRALGRAGAGGGCGLQGATQGLLGAAGVWPLPAARDLEALTGSGKVGAEPARSALEDRPTWPLSQVGSALPGPARRRLRS